ncbi:serine hydrolase domain-containing protein [Mesorhizobium sp. M0674]|uniref:serine hydrolase domain-containing protein n=1 Tax=unclassified Mesorhizobium TaxID=325217 RepID=UPI0033392B83
MRSSIDAVIEGKLKKFSIPGSAVGIVQDGRLVWAKGYGWADVTRKVPMTPKTIMNQLAELRLYPMELGYSKRFADRGIPRLVSCVFGFTVGCFY